MRSSRIYPLTLWEAQDLDSSGTLESIVIPCWERVPDVLMFRVVKDGGTPDVKIEVAISNDGRNFNSYSSQDPLVASTNTEFSTQNPQEYHALTCPLAPFIKIRVTDLSAADNNVVDATLWVREQA